MDTAIQVQASDLLNAKALKEVERVAKAKGVSLTMAMVLILNENYENVKAQSHAPTVANKAPIESAREGEEVANVSMEVFRGNSRAFNALEKNGVRSPKELEGWTEEQLRNLKGCGDKVVTYIKEVMAEMGLSLASDDLSSEGELKAPEARQAPEKVKDTAPISKPIKVEDDDDDDDDDAFDYYADTVLLGHGLEKGTDEYKQSLTAALNNYAMAWDLSLGDANARIKLMFKDGTGDLPVEAIFETLALSMPATEATKAKILDKFSEDFITMALRSTYDNATLDQLPESEARHLLSLSPPEEDVESSDDDEWESVDSAFDMDIF